MVPEAGAKSPPIDLLAHLRRELFWDTDATQLDSQRDAQLIIERTAERGTWEEMQEVWAYYGNTRIRQAVQASRGLTERTVCFFATIFDLPRTTLRSYQRGHDHVASA